MMKIEKKIEIKDNDFLRQFEAKIDDKTIVLEYSAQPRKIFLTKFRVPNSLRQKGMDQVFLKAIFDKFETDQVRVVPTCPEVAKFFKAHRAIYKNLLPVGINI